MKIKLIPTFKTDIDNISKAELVINGERKCRIDLLKTITNKNIKAIEIHDNVFNDCSTIHYEVLYNNGIFKAFGFKDKEDAVFITNAIPVLVDPYLRINTLTPFKNTFEDKSAIFSTLKDKISKISILPNLPFGNNNLLYYTVYGDGYVELLNKSLQSIKENTTNINFDVLLILDSNTKVLVEGLEIISYFNVYYHLVEKPTDGIEASMNKTKIYDYEYINEYNKILFFDCDIITVKDLNIIFNAITNDDVFYTISNKEVFIGSYNTHYHGLKFNTEEIINIASVQNNIPFNAGQYAFINTSRMREHFKNINWFISMWPSSFFFEQSFLNVYFVYANILDGALNGYFTLANATVNNLSKKHSDETVAIHFIAPALRSDIKIDYIGKYFLAYK